MMSKRMIVKKLESITNEENYNTAIYNSENSQQYWRGIRNGLCLVLEENNCNIKYKLPWE